MPEHRLHITVAEHGADLANGERVLDAFMEAHPEVGPSVSQNTAVGTLSVTFSLDAADANDAYERGREVFADGVRASSLAPTPIVGLEIELVPADELDPADEPEPLPA